MGTDINVLLNRMRDGSYVFILVRVSVLPTRTKEMKDLKDIITTEILFLTLLFLFCSKQEGHLTTPTK